HQLELLQSRSVIEHAINSARLAELPELQDSSPEVRTERIKQQLSISRIRQSEIYELAFVAQRPESAQRVLAAVLDAFLQFSILETDVHQQRVLEFLAVECKRLEADVAIKRARLRELTGVNVVNGAARDAEAPQPNRSVIERLAKLTKDLILAQAEMSLARAQVSSLRGVTDEENFPLRDEALQIAEVRLEKAIEAVDLLGEEFEAERPDESDPAFSLLALEFTRIELQVIEEVHK